MDWIASFEALYNVYYNGAYSNMAINETLHKHRGANGSFVRMFVKGVIRDSIKIDYIINKLAKSGIESIRDRVLVILRMGIYSINELDSVPKYAAVNESVKLAKLVSKGSDKFVNAILRNYIRNIDNLTVSEELDIKYSFPKDLITLIKNQYGEDFEKILSGLNTPTKICIRANLLKNSREELIELLNSKYKIQSSIDELNQRGIICEGGNLIDTEEYKAGCFSIQSRSSLQAIEHFSPKSNSKVLDLCAAPGGKTFAMAEIMENEGEIISCDIYKHKIDVIEAGKKRLGLNNVKTLLMDGTKYNSDFESIFDYVLVDAPCSGLGVICNKPEIKIKADVKMFDSLIETQRKLLENAIRYTKDGGIIEYSTCTINKNENDDVVQSVLKSYNNVQILENNLILPYNNMTGFYYCILKK